MAKSTIKEFKSMDGQGETADPVVKGDTGRPADQSNAEAPKTFATKAEAMASVMNALSGLPKEAIGDVFKGLTDSITAKGGKRPADQENSEAPRTQGSSKVAQEDLDHMFDGTEITEELRSKATVVFEAALNARLVSEVARIEEEFNASLTEAVEEKITQLAENVDKYLTYAVEQWAKDNELAIETGLKAEVTEDFIQGLKKLFAENYVEIPEDKINLVDELTKKVAEQEEKINSLVSESVDSKGYIEELETKAIFAEATANLPLTHQEKFKTLIEGIEYSSVPEFTKKLNIIKETYFADPKSGKKAPLLEEVDETPAEEEKKVMDPSDPMTHYVAAITQTSKS